jgi:hypothetical protein
MTLSPVFRSHEAVEALRREGIWDRLAPAAAAQSEAIARVTRDLPLVLDAKFLAGQPPSGTREDTDMTFFQDFFFLILFRSVLEAIQFSQSELTLFSELNFCIKGTITAADNLFDDQDKSLLPLNAGEGARFRSILQLLSFERLTSLTLARAVAAGILTDEQVAQVQKVRLSRMAAIGSLEGSEEGGVARVLDPSAMVEQVHRVRGGALFELAFIAPRLIHSSVDAAVIGRAQNAISRLGTAFQIVDDLTDFETDVARGTHNLLVAQITHDGSTDERTKLAALRHHADVDSDIVVEHFADSGRKVVARAELEARQSLEELQSLGYWFPPALSDLLVRAIVGLEGVERIRAL